MIIPKENLVQKNPRARRSRMTWRAALLGLLATTSAFAQLRVGDAPPDLLGVDRDGHDVHLSAYQGKVVILSFWASWCPFCLHELPVLEKIQRVIGKSQIEVIAINTDRNRSNYLSMRRQLKDFEFTMARDEHGDVFRSYAAKGLPYLLMVSKTGHVAYVHAGYSEKALNGFVDEVNSLLSEPGTLRPSPSESAAATASQRSGN
jgi:thiol-disulfide isomerase/thioredoxin